PVVPEVLVRAEEFARIGLRRLHVVGVVIPAWPARSARVEERARPHRDADGAAPILVDHRDALGVVAILARLRLPRRRSDRREGRQRSRRQNRNRHQAHDSSQGFATSRPPYRRTESLTRNIRRPPSVPALPVAAGPRPRCLVTWNWRPV